MPKQSKNQPPSMEQVRAAHCLATRTNWSNKAGEYFAFLSMVHWDMPLSKRLKLANEMAQSQRV